MQKRRYAHKSSTKWVNIIYKLCSSRLFLLLHSLNINNDILMLRSESKLVNLLHSDGNGASGHITSNDADHQDVNILFQMG